MSSRRLLSVAAAAIVASIAFAMPANAESSISINDGNVPTTAAAFKGHECSDNLGGGPYADKDVWVFVLPGNHDTTGDFTSVTATWTTPGGTVTKTIPTDGGAIVLIGVSKAYIATPAGWTLTGATAVVTGTATSFNLTHTCPAGTSSPSPSASVSASASPSPESTPSPSDPGVSSTPSPSTSPTGGLPVTGTATTGILVAGVALVGIGCALLLAYRRRNLTDHAA